MQRPPSHNIPIFQFSKMRLSRGPELCTYTQSIAKVSSETLQQNTNFFPVEKSLFWLPQLLVLLFNQHEIPGKIIILDKLFEQPYQQSKYRCDIRISSPTLYTLQHIIVTVCGNEFSQHPFINSAIFFLSSEKVQHI